MTARPPAPGGEQAWENSLGEAVQVGFHASSNVMHRRVETVAAQSLVPDSEGILPSSEADAPSDQVLDLAYAAARRLGVSARRARRGIKSFASRSSRKAGKKIRSVSRDRKKKGRAKKSDTDGAGPGDEPAAVADG